MIKVFYDAETYYDKDYSLRKMTIPEYVRDPRFKVLGASIAIDDGPIEWYEGTDLPDLDWSEVQIIAHNMLFDGFILHEHFGITPKRWSCTQAMAKAILQLRSVSLANVAKALGLSAKGDGLTEGAGESDEGLITYAIQDTNLCRQIYNILSPALPEREAQVLHYTLRWGVQALLTVDISEMEAAADAAEKAQQQAILDCGVAEEVLSSNPQFAAWMAEEGIEVPMKTSITTGFSIPALAKGDPEWQELIVNPDYSAQQPVFKARELVKSTIGITRPRKMARIARGSPQHTMPMPLKYFGAHTGRWSGTDGYNVQNLPNGSVARTAIKAPPGYQIVVADSSQIELRLNAWWSGEQWILDTLESGRDIYIAAAAKHFKTPYNSIPKSDPRRKFGKALTLGSGYGMGWDKFRKYCASGPLGMDPIILSDREAMDAIYGYRGDNPNIAASWKRCDKIVSELFHNDIGHPTLYDAIEVHHEAILLPNGMAMLYPEMRAPSDNGFVYGAYGTNMYGAKLQENIVQGLARVVISDQLIEIENAGIITVGCTHDEILAIAPDDEAEDVYNEMVRLMSVTPSWAPGLPLEADGGFDRSYCK